MLFRVKLAAHSLFFSMDIFLDVYYVYGLVTTQQWVLAALQLAVLASSQVQQLSFGKVVEAIRESFRVGYTADVLLRVMQTEKLQEGFLSLLIQAAGLARLPMFDLVG